MSWWQWAGIGVAGTVVLLGGILFGWILSDAKHNGKMQKLS